MALRHGLQGKAKAGAYYYKHGKHQHCEPDCGSCGVSVSSMAKNESTPIVPTCTMPMPSVAVLPCERRSVTIIAAA